MAEGALGRGWLWLAAGATLAACAWDPLATAAGAKRTLGLGVCVGLAAVALARPLQRRAAPSAALLAWLVLATWLTATLAWGSRDAAPLASGLALTAAVALLATELEPAQAARAARVTAAALAVGLGAWATLGFALGQRGMQLHAGQGSPNWLGLALALTLPACARYARRGPGRWWYRAGLVLGAGGLLAAASRTAWLALASTATLGGWLWLWRRRPTLTRRLSLVLVPVALALGAAALSSARRPAQLEPSALDWRGSLAERSYVWRLSGRAAVAALPWGSGLGSFDRAFLAEQASALRGLMPSVAARRFSSATTAHQDYLELLIAGGLPALFGWLGALGLGARALWRQGRGEGALTLAALAACQWGDSALFQPAVALQLGLWLGVTRPAKQRERPPPLRPALGALLLSALGLVSALPSYLAERFVTEAGSAEPPRALLLLERAARLSPGEARASLALGLYLLELGQPHDAELALQRSWEAQPSLAAQLALGNASLLQGALPTARRRYERALALAPGSFKAWANLALLEVRAGDEPAARRAWERARELYPHHPALADVEQGLRSLRAREGDAAAREGDAAARDEGDRAGDDGLSSAP